MNQEWLLTCMGITLAAFVVTVIVHEVGHVVAGRLVGFQFSYVALGPLKISREGGKMRLGVLRARGLPLAFAATRPTDGHHLRSRMAVAIAGGPIGSLALALASLGGYLIWKNGWLGAASLALAAYSILILVITMVPYQWRGLASDGAQLLLLARGGAQAERHCAIALLAGMSANGRRGRDLPAEQVNAAVAVRDGSARDAVGAMFAYYWALDRGDVSGAGSYLDRALAAREKYPEVSRPALYREAAYYFARHRSDARAARAFLDQSAGGLVVKRHSVLRAEAAILLAEGEYEASLQRATEGLATLRRADGTLPRSDGVDLLQDLASLAANRREPVNGISATERLCQREA